MAAAGQDNQFFRLQGAFDEPPAFIERNHIIGISVHEQEARGADPAHEIYRRALLELAVEREDTTGSSTS